MIIGANTSPPTPRCSIFIHLLLYSTAILTAQLSLSWRTFHSNCQTQTLWQLDFYSSFSFDTATFLRQNILGNSLASLSTGNTNPATLNFKITLQNFSIPPLYWLIKIESIPTGLEVWILDRKPFVSMPVAILMWTTENVMYHLPPLCGWMSKLVPVCFYILSCPMFLNSVSNSVCKT